MPLDRDRRAEARRELLVARLGVGQQSVRDRIAAAGPADPEGQAGQFQLAAARQRRPGSTSR